MENYYDKKNCSCDKCEKKKRVEKHEKHEKHEKVEHRCNGCVCDQLRCLGVGTQVIIIGSAGIPSPLSTFTGFNEKDCCATFSTLIGGALFTSIVDCQAIQVLVFPPA